VGKSDAVVWTALAIASIVDGARLSYGKIFKFAHNNMDDLDRVLARVRAEVTRGGILVVVDGVFSMEGDIIDLPHLVAVTERHGARVFVDDAHSVGVLGASGAGTAEHFGLADKVDITMATFSKSFASLGGFIAAESEVISYIKHKARALIFSASIPPSNAAAVLAALDIIESEPERRENLWKNARRMQREFHNLGFNIGRTQTPIVPIVVGEDLDAFCVLESALRQRRLYEPGDFAGGAAGQAMIRTSYTATHTDEQLDRVVEVIARVGREKGLIS